MYNFAAPLAYVVPMVVPFMGFLFERAERWRTTTYIQNLIDLFVVSMVQISCDQNSEFELSMTQADADWQGTRLLFRLTEKDDGTEVDFKHLGWPSDNEHFRISCYCWAMYLRLLRRYVEFGETVPYEDRLDV